MIDYVISENLERRHLETGQRAAIGAELEPLYSEEAREKSVGRMWSRCLWLNALLMAPLGQARFCQI